MPDILKSITVALTLGCTLPIQASAQAIDTGYLTEPNGLALEDEMAIRQIIARHNHALDAEDYALYGSFFAEDGVFTSGFGNAVGPDQVAAALEQSRPFIINRRHIAANLVISGDGDRATVTSYQIVFERASAIEYVGSAFVIEELERRDGEWVITLHDSTLDPATEAFVREMMGN